ncbi:MAG: hypothetical protein AB2669_00510 [Candidatus Thiodiazotropha endolucinida]
MTDKNDNILYFDDYFERVSIEFEREMARRAELWATPLFQEAKAVTDKTHDLLNGEDGMGQIEGTMEFTRISLYVPKAFAYLATYLAIRQRYERPAPYDLWQLFLDGHRKNITTKMRNRFLEHLLFEDMHNELHRLATGGHHILYPEEGTEACLHSKHSPDDRFKKTIKLLRLALLHLISSNSNDLDKIVKDMGEFSLEGKAKKELIEIAGKYAMEIIESHEDDFDDIPF